MQQTLIPRVQTKLGHLPNICRPTALFLALSLSGCASQDLSTDADADTNINIQQEFERLEAGYQVLSKNAKTAKTDYFNPIIDNCNKAFASSTKRYYAARGPTETLFYTAKAMADRQTAEVLTVPCGMAHYLAAYADIDLGNVTSAEKNLKSALRWSPVNAQYQSELAHLMQIRRDWNEALRLFTEAEANAEAFSPDEVQDTELARAKRGIGFTLIELGRLEEAEVKFQECLEIDPNDKKAKHELAYIKQLGNKSL